MTEFGTVSMWLLPPVLGNKWVRRNSQAGTLVLTLVKRYKSVGVLNIGDTKMTSMFPSLRWGLRTGRPTHLSMWTTDETTYSLLLNLCFSEGLRMSYMLGLDVQSLWLRFTLYYVGAWTLQKRKYHTIFQRCFMKIKTPKISRCNISFQMIWVNRENTSK